MTLRQFLLIASKAKKPSGETAFGMLKDLQVSLEKADEIKQQNRDAHLRDPLSMVGDGLGSLGWVMCENSPKPHEHIHSMFGGAQMYGNKVLKEYKDK